MLKKIFAANWKLNKTPAESKLFIKEFNSETTQDFFSNKEIFIFPQNFSLDAVLTESANSNILFGPQQICSDIKGAFTGENSLVLAKNIGSKIVLIGHSERRQLFHENNYEINKKIKLSHELNILPVLCIGESLVERKENKTLDVCFEQLDQALLNIDREQRIIIAYEPVWAIGTGLVASLDQVKTVHAELYKKMTDLKFKNFQLLYGGSVKADNAKDLILVPHVDGFLIGGASLEAISFLEICKSGN